MPRYVFNEATGGFDYMLDDIDLRGYGTLNPRTTVQPWNRGARIVRGLDEQKPSKQRKRRVNTSNVPDNKIKGDYYTIQKGDTFYDILKKNGIKTSDMMNIAKSNGISDPDKIRVGQKIKLPGYVAPDGSKDRQLSEQVAEEKAAKNGTVVETDPTKPANDGGNVNKDIRLFNMPTWDDVMTRANDIVRQQSSASKQTSGTSNTNVRLFGMPTWDDIINRANAAVRSQNDAIEQNGGGRPLPTYENVEPVAGNVNSAEYIPAERYSNVALARGGNGLSERQNLLLNAMASAASLGENGVADQIDYNSAGYLTKQFRGGGPNPARERRKRELYNDQTRAIERGYYALRYDPRIRQQQDWMSRSSGALEEVYPEFYLLSMGRGGMNMRNLPNTSLQGRTAAELASEHGRGLQYTRSLRPYNFTQNAVRPRPIPGSSSNGGFIRNGLNRYLNWSRGSSGEPLANPAVDLTRTVQSAEAVQPAASAAQQATGSVANAATDAATNTSWWRALGDYYKQGWRGIRTLGRSGNKKAAADAAEAAEATTNTGSATAESTGWFRRALGRGRQMLSKVKGKKGKTKAKPQNNEPSVELQGPKSNGQTPAQTGGKRSIKTQEPKTNNSRTGQSKWEQENANKQRMKNNKYGNKKNKKNK